MRGQLPLVRAARPLGRVRPSWICLQCRAIQFSASPATESPRLGTGDAFGAAVEARDPAGMLGRLFTNQGYHWLTLVATRCSVRSHRLSLLPPLCHPVSLAETLHEKRHTCDCGRQGAKCEDTWQATRLCIWLTVLPFNRHNPPYDFSRPSAMPSLLCHSSTSAYPPRLP